MRRTFAYLAHVIIENYKDEFRACQDSWYLAKNAKRNGSEEQEALFSSIGNEHARKADALLKIIQDEKLATMEDIVKINREIIAEARA